MEDTLPEEDPSSRGVASDVFVDRLSAWCLRRITVEASPSQSNPALSLYTDTHFFSLNTFLCEDSDADLYSEWYCEENDHQQLITGWIPPILVSVWQNMIMPNALYYLVQASASCASLSQLERYIAHLFFLWDVLNIYLGGMLGGSVLYKINSAVKRPADLMHWIGLALPASSNLFVNYVCLRAFFLVPYQLLVPHPGIWFYIFRYLSLRYLTGFCPLAV